MKLLVIDHFGGDGCLDFVLRAQDDGHEVRWHVKKAERNSEIGRGLVTHVSDWRDHMRWADLVVLSDNTRYLREIDAWRKNHDIAVVGATTESAAWELDRKVGQEVFKKAGIAIPPFREFTDYDSAIAYVEKEGRPFVSKPSYDEADKSLSYVAKTPDDLIYMLGRWKKQQKLKGAFILQEKISGCEMAVGGWFGPHGFNSAVCENWEFKSLMAGDVGPNCGEMGTVLRFVDRSKLFNKVLRPLEDRLARLKYVGYVDVNCIIDEHGDPWPLEFTMRMGWPTFNIQQALVKGDHVEWLADLARGRDSKPFALQTVATGVVMALPDFPYGRRAIQDVLKAPVYGLTPSVRRRVHPCQMQRSPDKPASPRNGLEKPRRVDLLTAGDYVLVASGTGDSVRKARAQAYATIKAIQIPASPFWRPDIGQRLKQQLPLVQQHGYATGLEF